MAGNKGNNRRIQTDDYKIIIDEPAENAPDFKEHAERLSRIIVGSTPQFTVGIFGGWGTVKTTMMKMIDNEIKNGYSDIVTTIWFDPWRYEREEYSLAIQLLRTIILRFLLIFSLSYISRVACIMISIKRYCFEPKRLQRRCIGLLRSCSD